MQHMRESIGFQFLNNILIQIHVSTVTGQQQACRNQVTRTAIVTESKVLFRCLLYHPKSCLEGVFLKCVITYMNISH